MAARRASVVLAACVGGVVLYRAGRKYFLKFNSTDEGSGDSKVKMLLINPTGICWPLGQKMKPLGKGCEARPSLILSSCYRGLQLGCPQERANGQWLSSALLGLGKS